MVEIKIQTKTTKDNHVGEFTVNEFCQRDFYIPLRKFIKISSLRMLKNLICRQNLKHGQL